MSASPTPRLEVLLEQALGSPEPRAELERLCGSDKELHAKALAALEQFLRLEQGTELEQAAGHFPERIGAYRLIRKLGEGGMGFVFLAEHEFLKRLVALKLIRPELHLSLTAKQRFQREALAIARLQHDNIVTIYDAGEVQGTVFLAMELIEGQSLDERMALPQPISQEDSVRIVRDIARGLAAAHAAGVLHRDVKPSNIRIDKAGRARLLDFGLAQAEGTAQLTHSGAFQGTPAYASPEQIDSQGQPIDGRSDLYSLGVVLYELLTRCSPYKASGTLELFHSILSVRPPSPQEFRKELDPALCDLTLQLLEKQRNLRPASANDVAATLDAWLSAPSHESGTAKADSSTVQRFRWTAVAALGLGAALYGLWPQTRQEETRAPQRSRTVLGLESVDFGQRLIAWEATQGPGVFGDDEDTLGVVGASLEGLTAKPWALSAKVRAAEIRLALIPGLDDALGRGGVALEWSDGRRLALVLDQDRIEWRSLEGSPSDSWKLGPALGVLAQGLKPTEIQRLKLHWDELGMQCQPGDASLSNAEAAWLGSGHPIRLLLLVEQGLARFPELSIEEQL